MTELRFVPPRLSIASQMRGLISVLKCWQWKDQRYPSNGVIPICAISRTPHTVPIATQGSLFGQFPGNSVITACPEMNVGMVDSGWRACGAGLFLGGGGWDLLETSSGCHPPTPTPAEAVWQRISLIPLRSEAPFLWPVSPDVSENWRKKCSFWKKKKNQGSGPAGENWAKLAEHILKHTITSCNDIQAHCTPAILHFNSERQQDTVRLWGACVWQKEKIKMIPMY